MAVRGHKRSWEDINTDVFHDEPLHYRVKSIEERTDVCAVCRAPLKYPVVLEHPAHPEWGTVTIGETCCESRYFYDGMNKEIATRKTLLKAEKERAIQQAVLDDLHVELTLRQTLQDMVRLYEHTDDGRFLPRDLFMAMLPAAHITKKAKQSKREFTRVKLRRECHALYAALTHKPPAAEFTAAEWAILQTPPCPLPITIVLFFCGGSTLGVLDGHQLPCLTAPATDSDGQAAVQHYLHGIGAAHLSYRLFHRETLDHDCLLAYKVLADDPALPGFTWKPISSANRGGMLRFDSPLFEFKRMDRLFKSFKHSI